MARRLAPPRNHDRNRGRSRRRVQRRCRRLGKGLYEFKIGLPAAQTADLFPGRDGETEPEGPAKERTRLRVFFAVEDGRLLLLLAGYDKGADDGRRRQAQEIEIARRRLAKRRERR